MQSAPEETLPKPGAIETLSGQCVAGGETALHQSARWSGGCVRDAEPFRVATQQKHQAEQHILIAFGFADCVYLGVITFDGHGRRARDLSLVSDCLLGGSGNAGIIIVEASDLAPKLLALIDRGEELGVEIFSIPSAQS